MSGDGKPFIFTLNDEEIKEITDTPLAGRGGLQSLQKKLREQLRDGPTVSLNNAGFGQLIRYMMYPGGGGFEDRLRRAFIRSISLLFKEIGGI